MSNTKKATKFNVYLNGRLISSVWGQDESREDVRRCLIEQDGYNARIIVRIDHSATLPKTVAQPVAA